MLSSGDIPQWKKDLLQRRQSRNKIAPSVEQLLTSARAPLSGSVTVGRAGQQPSQTCNSSGAVAVVDTTTEVLARCNANTTLKYPVVSNNTSNSKKMVQERAWTDHNPIKAFHLVTQTKEAEKNVDSDSSEELQYGPGIVSKLKNRYLSLTLRETNAKTRPSILHMRKATSLEHLIDESDVDDDDDHNETENAPEDNRGKNTGERLFEPKMNGTSKHIPNRYKGAKFDMKRARSVEIISTADDNCLHALETRPKRESLHEEMLIKKEGSEKTDDKKMSEINDNKTFSNTIGLRLNRPKRIAPVMNEKEKPPLDVVRQTKKLFEKPELRTKPPACTGEVAAKVATYKNIISQTKANKKPPVLKQKPLVTASNKKPTPMTNGRSEPKVEARPSTLKSPETPDVTSTSLPSPVPDVSKVNENHSPEFHHVNGYPTSSLSETPDLILHSSHSYAKSTMYKDVTEDFLKAEISHSNKLKVEKDDDDDDESKGEKIISAETQRNLSVAGNSMVFNFSTSQASHNHLPNIQQKAQLQNNQVPLTQPLRIEIAGANFVENRFQTSTPSKHSPPSHFSPQIKKQVSPLIQELSPKFTKTSPQKIPSPQSIKSPSPPIIKTSPNKSKPPLSPPPKLQSPKFNSKPPLSPPPKYHSKPPLSPPLKHHSKPPLSPPPKLFQPSPTQQQSKKPNQPSTLEILSPSVAAEQYEISERVIEKNLKNAAKSAGEKPGSERVQTIEVPRPKRTARSKQEQNSLVFNFTNRKDVPDYVGNHGPIRTGKIERPKVGEGGITLLPGASLDESIVDDDDIELLRSRPPSPLNVTFINDNVLIDGKSSLSKKTKKSKMSIKFVDSGPDIYEYPSEASLLEDSQVSATNSVPVGHSVPSLSGSSLATYTPKSTFPSEEFQLGMKPASSPPETKQIEVEPPDESDMQETEQPIMFSAGTNTDILF